MTRCLSIALTLSVGCAVALAQNNASQNPFSADAKQSYTGIKNTLLKAADKMPEENYSFRTVQQVRTYGEMVGHVAATKVTMFVRQLTKLGVLNFNVSHDNEMYGTMVAYLRIKGIVPPSSEGRP